MKLADSVFLITGGSSGLGAATARMALDAGARVVIADLAPPREGVLGPQDGERAVYVQTNVTDEASAQAAVDTAVQRFGRLDVLVNAAGIGPAEKIHGKNGPHRLDSFSRTIQVNLIDYVTMGSGQVSSAAFPFAEPAHGDLARELFRCALRWDAGWCGLELPVAPLDRPLRSGNAEAWLEAVQRCQAEVSRLQRQHSLSARVRRLMLSGPSGFPSLQVTARQLNLSARTLHRKLLDEGTSYRNILEQVRHTLAVEHVQAGRLTMQEIAFLLGYDDQANFRRAFKRWEGVAPTAYRERGGRPAPLASH